MQILWFVKCTDMDNYTSPVCAVNLEHASQNLDECFLLPKLPICIDRRIMACIRIVRWGNRAGDHGRWVRIAPQCMANAILTSLGLLVDLICCQTTTR